MYYLLYNFHVGNHLIKTIITKCIIAFDLCIISVKAEVHWLRTSWSYFCFFLKSH